MFDPREYYLHMTREQLIEQCVALSNAVHELATEVMHGRKLAA